MIPYLPCSGAHVPWLIFFSNATHEIKSRNTSNISYRYQNKYYLDTCSRGFIDNVIFFVFTHVVIALRLKRFLTNSLRWLEDIYIHIHVLMHIGSISLNKTLA